MSVELPEIGIEMREVVLVDDVVSTGRTLAAAARFCVARGAAKLSAIVAHGLFIGDALGAVRQADGVRARGLTGGVRCERISRGRVVVDSPTLSWNRDNCGC